MVEITIYEADDGTRFDDYRECADYERQMEIKNGKFANKVVIWDAGFNGTVISEKITPTEISEQWEQCRYLRCDDEVAAWNFVRFIEDLGFFFSLDDDLVEEDCVIPGDIYEYDEMRETWINYSKKIKNQVENEKKMREWGK